MCRCAHSASIGNAVVIESANRNENCKMQREFTPASKMVRSALAVAGIVVSMFVVGLVDGLFTHYSDPVHLAISRPAVIAHR